MHKPSLGAAKVAECVECSLQSAPPTAKEFLSLPQGANAQISRGTLPPGGTWQAKLGKIDANGQYTAPQFYYPAGYDTVEYWATNGTVYSTDILVKRDPTKPYHGGNALFKTEADEMVDVPDDGEWHEVVEPGTTDELPTPLECVPIVAVNVTTDTEAQQSVVQLQTDQATSATQQMFAQATPLQVVGAQKCKNIGPIYPRPTGGCVPGTTKEVRGPLKTFSKASGPWSDNATLTMSATLAAEIKKIFKIDVSIGGTYTIRSKPIDYVQSQTIDKWACGADGQWTYVGSTVCKRFATGVQTIPDWGAWWLGYNKDGSPKHWSPWSCGAI